MGKVKAVNREVQRYLDAVPDSRKPLVRQFHALIVGLYPEADIDMSYRMPTYKAKGGSHSQSEALCVSVHVRRTSYCRI